MDHAHFERDDAAQGGRWTRCLLSVPSLEVLRELREQGEFPYPLEAGPSEAEARWQLAQARGARTRERLPLSLYLEPASIASRDALKWLLH
jgi:hypothetical protein